MKDATRLGQACTLLILAVLAGVAEMIIALLASRRRAIRRRGCCFSSASTSPPTPWRSS
ncbi:hypothetical protein [Microlunatus sp. GCM10028923]|uniref:hypothetical protein n=1 Tax=Microlunatus sp. GCM10028923 TaxID=3273400 RepID=UPI00361F8953